MLSLHVNLLPQCEQTLLRGCDALIKRSNQQMPPGIDGMNGHLIHLLGECVYVMKCIMLRHRSTVDILKRFPENSPQMWRFTLTKPSCNGNFHLNILMIYCSKAIVFRRQSYIDQKKRNKVNSKFISLPICTANSLNPNHSYAVLIFVMATMLYSIFYVDWGIWGTCKRSIAGLSLGRFFFIGVTTVCMSGLIAWPFGWVSTQ